MADIIGRKEEIQQLQHRYQSDKAEFIAVYGRRRVGKTFLIKELFKNQFAFMHTGLAPMVEDKRTKKLRGLSYNEYSSVFQSVITLDDLFG